MQTANNTPNPVTEFMERWSQNGTEAASKTGDQKSDPALIATAKAAISSEALLIFKGPLDPKRPADKRLLESHAETNEAVRRLETVAEQSKRRYHAAEESIPANEAPPEAPGLTIGACVLALTGVTAQSLVELDAFQAIDDEVIKLGAAALMGLGISAACITSMFGLSAYKKDASAISTKPLSGWWGVTASATVMVAMFIIRLALTDDVLLAAGLSVLDLAILLKALHSAKEYRHKMAVWSERMDSRLQLIKAADSCEAQLKANQQDLAIAVAERDQAEANLYYRQALDFSVPLVAQAAMNAWEQAYAYTLSENRNPYGSSNPFARAARPTAA